VLHRSDNPSRYTVTVHRMALNGGATQGHIAQVTAIIINLEKNFKPALFSENSGSQRRLDQQVVDPCLISGSSKSRQL